MRSIPLRGRGRGRGVCRHGSGHVQPLQEQEIWGEWRVCEQETAEQPGEGTGHCRHHRTLSNSEEDGLEKADTGGREVLSSS